MGSGVLTSAISDENGFHIDLALRGWRIVPRLRRIGA
jgi:hypothetical protein